MRKPDFLFPEPPPIAPEFNPEGASRHRPHRKSLGLAPRRPASRAASQTGAPRLALARLSLRARLRFPAEPDLGRSSGCARERPGGLGPAPLRAAGLRVGRGRSPGASARTGPRHSRRRAQVEVLCGLLTSGPKAGRAPSYPGKVYFRASLPRPGCALPSSPRVEFVFFVFFLRRFSIPPSLCGTRPPPTPRANWRAVCACPGGVAAGPGAVSPTGRGPSGGGRRAAKSSAGGRCAERPGRGGGRASARALRPSPSVGPKLLKLQNCAGARPPAANKTKQNAAKGKAKWRC